MQLLFDSSRAAPYKIVLRKFIYTNVPQTVDRFNVYLCVLADVKPTTMILCRSKIAPTYT